MKKSRYRIKIITYKTGRQEFHAQFKSFIGWITIISDGEANLMFKGCYADDRERALKRIDKHFAGNCKKQTIEFEHIYK